MTEGMIVGYTILIFMTALPLVAIKALKTANAYHNEKHYRNSNHSSNL